MKNKKSVILTYIIKAYHNYGHPRYMCHSLLTTLIWKNKKYAYLLTFHHLIKILYILDTLKMFGSYVTILT